MSNTYFKFKQFRIDQDHCAMKVTTDACILGSWAPAPQNGTILDIGTGTGLLALMMAQRTQSMIDAIEIDEASFLQAKENVLQSPWSGRLQIIQGDVRKFSPDKKYNFIICNPPFFENQLRSSSSLRNKARHDISLNTSDLLKATGRLLKKPSGKFTVLLPASQANPLLNHAENENLFLHRQLHIQDQKGKEFIRSILVFGCNPESKILEKELAIRNSDGTYTSSFQNLLKDFYLHLESHLHRQVVSIPLHPESSLLNVV